MSYNPLDPEGDPFKPPAISIEVGCLHCQEVYDSYRIEWRVKTGSDGKQHGFWCCPTPGCDGAGFGFDILPTDMTYQDEHGGWIQDAGGEDFDEDFEDEDSDDDLDGPRRQFDEDDPSPW